MIIDTDIGDDVDDAFALALAVKSPELRVLGVTTTFGDTEARAKITDRFLGEVGRADIPVMAGKATATKNPMSQRKYGEGHFVKASHGDAVTFLLDQIRKYPGEITLIAIGPLMNVGSAIDRDAGTFRKLKRVVLMGGSVRRGYGDLEYTPAVPPMPEWNILNDVASARKLFASGVPLLRDAVGFDAVEMDEVKREFLFSQGTAVTDQLAVLYHLWGQETPTLFDPMTIAFVLRPELCPVRGLHIRVEDDGFTREEPGAGECAGLPGLECGGFLSVLFEESGGRDSGSGGIVEDENQNPHPLAKNARRMVHPHQHERRKMMKAPRRFWIAVAGELALCPAMLGQARQDVDCGQRRDRRDHGRSAGDYPRRGRRHAGGHDCRGGDAGGY